jgi:hypothetical protein
MESKPKRPDQSWEDFAEQRIRDAQEAGDFSALPGFGQPIRGLDEPHNDQWWIKEKLRREKINHLPPALAIKLDVERTLAALYELRYEADVRRAVRELNDRIRAANYSTVWGPPSTQMPVEEEQVVAEWRAKRSSSVPL